MNEEMLKKIKNNPNAQKIKDGDMSAMQALLKDLMASKDGIDLINQVKKATE